MSDSPEQRAKTAPLTLKMGTSPLNPADLQGAFQQDTFIKFKAHEDEQPERRRNVERELEEFRSEAQKYSAWFEQMNNNLSGRVRMLRFISDMSRRPDQLREVSIKSLRADQATMVRSVIRQMEETPTLSKRIRIAIQRFDDAAAAVQAVTDLYRKVEELPADEAFALIKDYSIPKLKGQLYLLTTYDLLFRTDALLNQMFPPQERDTKQTDHGRKAESDRSKRRAPEKPPVPQEVPPQSQATPPPQDGLLQGFMKKIKPGS